MVVSLTQVSLSDLKLHGAEKMRNDHFYKKYSFEVEQ